jgi:hypothetical protein
MKRSCNAAVTPHIQIQIQIQRRERGKEKEGKRKREWGKERTKRSGTAVARDVERRKPCQVARCV